MRYLSVCSGIEAASVAWHRLGWTPVAFSEIDPFACAVLATRYPNVPNLGNMENYHDWKIEAGSVDVLVGGTPCQSFSVAGLRRGLDDPRGNLALVYLGLVAQIRPRYIVWENVPGVLSSSGGRDFGAFIGALAELGYGFAWRVLDAQFIRVESHPHAVPQRRRRVFVVGCAGGDSRRAAEILLEPEGVRGNPPTRRASRQGTAGSTAAGARDGLPETVGALCADTHAGAYSGQDAYTGRLVPTSYGIRSDAVREGVARTPSADAEGVVRLRDPGLGIYDQLSPTLDTVSPHIVAHPEVAATLGRRGTRSHTELDGHGAHVVEPLPFDTTQITHPANRSQPQPGDPCHPLARGAHAPAVVFSCKDYGGDASIELAPTIRAMPHDRSHANGGGQLAVAFDAYNQTATGGVTHPRRVGTGNGYGDEIPQVLTASMAVRRLTPRECERLQGFPDDWTAITYRGKPASDGPRYKALGNSMAVNVMSWIGERIALNERSHSSP